GAPLDVVAYNGKAILSPALLTVFDLISLKAGDEIRADGAVALPARWSITLDAPLIGGTAGSTLALDAAYVAMGNSDPRYQSVRSFNPRTAMVSVHADTIDLIGQLSTDGIGTTQLTANGDIRAQGVLPINIAVTTQRGGLTTAGDVVLAAAQIF